MKKIIIIAFVIPAIIIACTTKASQKETSAANDSLAMNIDNFVKGKLYHYYSVCSEDRELKIDLELTKDEKGEDGQYIYGTYILFSDSAHYSIYNIEPCGNDCFFRTVGTYYLSANDTITMMPDSTTYRGECGDTPTEYGNGNKEVYKIARTNNDSIIELLLIPKE